jgi:D-galactose 1-dehydrogenase
MAAVRIALIGFGKIARDQHMPAIAANPDFTLCAVVSPRAPGPEGVPGFASTEEMLKRGPRLDAVAICTPPTVRYAAARLCLEAGLHTLLEKPPGVTLGEVQELARVARARDVTFFTTWHAQYNPAVAAAAQRLASARIDAVRITWREDVRKWHPGQQWIWEPGGFGVFDPGINAFSIATRIVPGALLVRKSELCFPENRQMPIAARLRLASPAVAGPIDCTLDWRHQGEESWTIEADTDGGRLALTEGGSRLEADGRTLAAEGPGEYPTLYAKFAELVSARACDVDLEPLRLAADAFMAARRSIVESFED